MNFLLLLGTLTLFQNLLLEIPALYISYVNIENPTTNTTVYCKPKNIQGEDLCSLNVFVHRPYTFNVIQTPTGTYTILQV